MSGPKVVRIVTLEEIQAICRRLIAQVAAGGNDLRGFAKRLGVLDAALEASLAARLRQLQEMFAQGRWMELQKLGGDTLAFYPAEKARLQATAAAAAEVVRTRRRRIADSARTIAAAIRAAGATVPPELDGVASHAASAPEAELNRLEQMVATAVSLVPASQVTEASRKEAGELAARLADGSASQTLADWARSRVAEPTRSERRLDALLAEADTLAPDVAAAFSERVARALREEVSYRRALLTDSLVLDLSAQVGEARKRQAAATLLREARAVLGIFDSRAASELSKRIEAAELQPEHLGAASLLEEAKALIETEEKTAAAASRRRAILGALSSLGYEVREAVETAWLQDGRVILRKPGTEDYGLEVGSPADVSRLQVRLVGSDRAGSPRTAQRDADQETIWCSEFNQLRAQLAKLGDELAVERALEAGVQAVRTVTLPDAAEVPRVQIAPQLVRRSPHSG
jgi:hypothetical protein